MKYKIVGDSCCDFTAEDLKKEYISRVPLILTVGDTDVIDDDTFDQEKYLDMVEKDGAPVNVMLFFLPVPGELYAAF